MGPVWKRRMVSFGLHGASRPVAPFRRSQQFLGSNLTQLLVVITTNMKVAEAVDLNPYVARAK